MKKLAIFAFLFLFIFLINLKAQEISGEVSAKCVAKGKEAKGKIVIDLPSELHINTNIPDNEFSIPTTLKLEGAGIEIKNIRFPKGISRKFEFSETPLNVYENRVEIDFTFIVSEDFQEKDVKIRATVGYQACTNEVCYPPRKKTLDLVAAIE